ncbi:hypothetical protein BHMPCIPO_06444 [Ensifer sesbaniae]|nr:hypothetical protein [Ensifer sesbaniae]
MAGKPDNPGHQPAIPNILAIRTIPVTPVIRLVHRITRVQAFRRKCLRSTLVEHEAIHRL